MCRRRPSNTSPVAGCSSAYPLTTRRSSSKLALWWGFLRADRQRGFDLTQAPLARCTLLQWDECHWQLIWTFHHMLADGHSYPMLIREAFDRYEALQEWKELDLPSPPPYKDFIEWLGCHHREQASRAETCWRTQLQGF